MRNMINYVMAGILAYSALAPANANATSSHEYKCKNYRPQIRAENLPMDIFPNAIIIKADQGETPLEAILNVPGIEILEPPTLLKPCKPNFMPTPERMKAMEKNIPKRK